MEKMREKPQKSVKNLELIPDESINEHISSKSLFEDKCIQDDEVNTNNMVDTVIFKKQKSGLRVGDIIEYGNDRFEIIKKIAAGGFGAVYTANNVISNQIVAIKRFFYQKYNEDDGQNDAECYWRRETEILEKQNHSSAPAMRLLGALKVTDFETPEYYIIMEFVDGFTLDDWFVEIFGNQQYLTEDQIKTILMDVIIPLCDHLQYCHEQGIIHRDITPRNIIVAEEFNKIIPILIDWGVSKEVELETVFQPPKPYFIKTVDSATGISSLGNPPETISGYEPVAASDIYMMGHILYFLLSGGDVSQIPATTKDYVLDPSKINSTLPPALVKLVKQMTQYEPADRISSFKIVKAEIMRYFSKQSNIDRKGDQIRIKLRNQFGSIKENYQQNAPKRQEKREKIKATTRKFLEPAGENIRNTIKHGNIVEKAFLFIAIGLIPISIILLFIDLVLGFGFSISMFIFFFMYAFTKDLRKTLTDKVDSTKMADNNS